MQAPLDQARSLLQAGRLVEAEQLYSRLLADQPGNAAFLESAVAFYLQQARFSEALSAIDRAIALDGNRPEFFNSRGRILHHLGRIEPALADFDHALRLNPSSASALTNRGVTLQLLRRPQEALKSYDSALEMYPNFPEALYNRVIVLRELNRPEDALRSCDQLLAIRPDLIELNNISGVLLQDLNRLGEALACFDRILLHQPNHADAQNNRGVTLHRLKRHKEALACFTSLLKKSPANTFALSNRGHVLLDIGRFAEALACLDEALTINPRFSEALFNRATALMRLNRLSEALEAYERLRILDPIHRYVLSGMANAALHLCDWDRTAAISMHLIEEIREDRSVVAPLVFLGYSAEPLQQLLCAQRYAFDRMPARSSQPYKGSAYRHRRIRLAYLSADFHEHATTVLTAGLFEQHNRSKFEVTAISYGPDDDSPARRRLINAFDAFHDVRTMSDSEVARLLSSSEIDIAIDLKGYTQDARPEILANRAAPVQVNYLGYPGTMGADFIDYVIADPIVLPFDQQAFYAEKIVHMPESYQVNDGGRPMSRLSARVDAGLPERSFVFCCFNTCAKITPIMFDIWMRLLWAIPHSVLWLLEDNKDVSQNLLASAAARGVNPERIIFAPRMPFDYHMSRLGLADLFLDTLPYNAHTTASDALWAGLPLLTCLGDAFPGRVAASLLMAVGLPELITKNLEDYEKLAISLSHDGENLRSFRERLKSNVIAKPLFNTNRFCRHLEGAYTTMREIAERGEAPRSFAVSPIASSNS